MGFAAIVLTALGAGSGVQAHADDGNPLLPLVDAAAQRLQTADPVAAYKFRTGGAIDDPPREQQVIDAVTADATAKGVDPAYVRDVFRNQIDATVSVEHSRFAQWKLDPAAVPSTTPDLAASRTTIDGLNHTMVNEIADQWSTLHSPACPAELTDAVDTVVRERNADPAALGYATHAYCR
ncbi:chorismate mutase [Mycobacterium sp. 21AC1]|nr:chorismate mutase [Mycobacterium sp. 21AC1]MDV3126638.1 chorismate mutase [Mycobacterium sp. 21AC1]